MANTSEYYRAQAATARAEADAATLDNVRDRAMRSVAAFEGMAANIDRVAVRRAEREAATGERIDAVPAPIIEA